jgi:Xaa-Pro aminopeptidase
MKKGRLIIASSEHSADIFYESGFHGPDPFVFFAVGREKAIVVTPLEYQRALNESKKGVRVFNNTFFSEDGKTHPGIKELIIEISRRYEVTSWSVPTDFPLVYAKILEESGCIVDCSAELFVPKRVVKTRKEADLIRKVQKINEEAMKLAARILTESSVDAKDRLHWNGSFLTSDILRSEIELFLKKNACSASRTIAACGTQAAEPHNQGSGIIMAGKTVILDIFPRSDFSGYWGDMTRTFVKGKAPAKVKRAFDAVFEAKETARKAARAGVSASLLHEKAFKVLEKRNFPTGFKGGKHFGFIHGLGHGVGLEIHEAPRVSPLNGKALEAGNVVTIEPGLYYSDWGGIRLEDLVLILEDGCETFNDPSSVLEIP